MYHFYGILDRSSPRHESDHRQSLATIRNKFPVRSAAFKLIQKQDLTLFGSHFRSARAGVTELFFTGEFFNEDEILAQTGSALTIEAALLNLFLKFGDTAFSKLNGSFMIILLEHDSGKCRIVNDQMNALQVFYYAHTDFILFASELKFLFCHPRCPRKVDWSAALKRPIPFLIVNAERHYDAWFTDIKLLEEGNVLQVQPGQSVTVKPYWNPWQVAPSKENGSQISSGEHDVAKYTEAYMELLEDAVRIRCASKGSSFSMFSGGVDSTIIAALALKYGDVGTFSFATQATVRDGATDMCKRLAEDLGVSNTQVVIPFDELVTDGQLWLKHIWSMESPLAHKDAIGKAAMHAAITGIQPGVQHIMSGTGSDQLNGGLVRWFVENAEEDADEMNWDRVMQEIRTEMLKPVIGHQYDTFWGSRDLLHMDYLASISESKISDYPWPEFVHGCLHANNYILVWDELRAGAWQDRGVRFPFMDHRFVPFILDVPRDLHQRLFFDKQILRRGARNILPSYLTEKAKAPVVRPGEDRRMKVYREILLGRDEQVLQMLLSAMKSGDVPVDHLKFEAKVRRLVDEPEQAGWAYLMHLAGLVVLDQLPDQDERSMNLHDHIMPHVDIVLAASPSMMKDIRAKLAVKSREDLLQLPLHFSSNCSLVSDVFTNTHFLVKDNELCYQLEEENAEWRIFLRSIDNVRSAHAICVEEGLDLQSFHSFFSTSLEEGILSTEQITPDHAST